MITGPVDARPALLALLRQEACEQSADHRARTCRSQAALDVTRSARAGTVVVQRTSLCPGLRLAVAGFTEIQDN